MTHIHCTDENYLTGIEKHTYEITSPVRMRVRQTNGETVLMGYGIGERVEVLERGSICAVAHTPKLKEEILLADGGVVTEFPTHNFARMLRA